VNWSRVGMILGMCILHSAVLVVAQDKPSSQTPAQEVKSAITGTVSDQTGAGVGGATVTADNGAGSAPSVTTDDQGLYAITDLSAGSYTISVVLHGTRLFQGKVELSPGQVLTLSVAGAPIAQPEPPSQAGQAAPPSQPPPSAAPPASAPSQNAGSQAPATQPKETSPASAAPTTPPSVPSTSAPPPSAPAIPATLTSPAAATETTPPSSTAPAAPAPPSSSSQEASAPAQTPTVSAGGAFSGTGIGGLVTDQTGAVLVGATVTINNASGVVQTTVSDDKGNYAFRGLSAGTYTLKVTMKGFKPFEAPGIAFTADQSLPLDASLEPGGEKTEVTVEGQKVAQVETETAQVSGTITEKEVVNLGLNGRNFTQLIALTPGVSNQTGQDEAKVGVVGSVKYSVNGGRVEYNTFEVDGSDVLNAGLNRAESTLVVYPSLDAIQEVKVLTSNYGAMYGRTASGTVLVTTKSGGAQWHGDAYEFVRNEALNARNYFDQTKSAPLYRRNDFGFSIGGPLYIPNTYNANKDKTFIFWSEEFRLERSPNDLHPDFNHAVPSLAERQGDFSDVCPANNDPTNPAPGLFFRSRWPDCPSAGTTDQVAGALVAFPNNQIFQTYGVLDKNALALLSTSLIPLPNATTGCNSSIGSCYDAVISEPTHWREELIRLDQNFSTKIRGSFRFIHDAWNTTVPVPQWSYLHESNIEDSFPTVQNRFVGPGVSGVARLTQTISPTFLNDFTASFTNSHITLTNTNGPGGANYQRPAALEFSCASLPSLVTVVDCPLGSLFKNGFGGKAPGIIIAGKNLAYGGRGFEVDQE